MEQKYINEEKVRETVAFHGHLCPGLAVGIRAAEHEVFWLFHINIDSRSLLSKNGFRGMGPYPVLGA